MKIIKTAYITFCIAIMVTCGVVLASLHSAHGATLENVRIEPDVVLVQPAIGLPTVIRVPETVITAPRHSASKPKLTWTCGRVEENGVGGSQRTCEWK